MNGMKLKQMREALGLTQKELGKILGKPGEPIPQETISRWEKGRIRHPTILNLAMQHLRCKRKKRN
jgi:transcriptional regulator with XRE-family HTH domain